MTVERQNKDFPTIDATKKIVFFDGICGLCNRFVDFLLTHDHRGQLQYAPLQGETAHDLLNVDQTEKLDTVVFATQGKLWTHSSAVVRILWELGPFWKCCALLLWIIPRPIRNIGYLAVSKSRYRLFGKSESCRMPQPGEQERFLP